MSDSVRYLLLQIRNPGDAMRAHEVACFARALRTRQDHIAVVDLLQGSPSRQDLVTADVVLLGGSGHYSVVDEGPFVRRAFDVLRELHERRQPVFASCWGFQAMARALGGRVVRDPARAEVGTHRLRLTAAGRDDPVFAPLGAEFVGQMGHEDRVAELPPNAILLASSETVENQAYRLADAPVYCTQFHPELTRTDLLQRLDAYPEYIKHLTGMTVEEFAASLQEAPETEALLSRFVRHVLD